MTQEEKEQLLFVDLCARQPYGIKVLYEGNIETIQYLEPQYYEVKLEEFNYTVSIDDIKVYLRPMSSMTEEEENEYYTLEELSRKEPNHGIDILDWLNAHYFDYRDLIGKGITLPAPEGMYIIK